MSVVIVNYGTADLTLKCVESIKRWNVVDVNDIVVVDNGSRDDSVAMLAREMSGVKLINSGRNSGFAAGVNIGAAEVHSEYLLVLNPDTYFEDHSIEQALLVLNKSPDIGLVGLGLVNPDGTRQYSARRFYSVLDILLRRLPLGGYWPFRKIVEFHLMVSAWKTGAPFDADWVMGTGFIIRRDLFERIGRMDEAYFLYMEDVDLCARVWGSGFRVVCIPGARLVHYHQRSSSAWPLRSAGKEHLKSLLVFAKTYNIPFFMAPKPHQILRKK